LVSVASAHAQDAGIHAELARLYFERGEHDAAGKQVAAALALEREHPLARWIEAEIFRTSGKPKEADAAYKWFVDYYNEQDDIDDPDTLRLIGLAAAQYARWNRLADQYSFLVKELYPDILRLEKNYWPAHFEAGLLFLEKFNQADAAKQFNQALAINPNAAEVHAALAALAVQNYDLVQAKRSIERALEINPELLWAQQLQADVHLSNFDAASAIATLNDALKLNPHDEATLGRLAAAYAAREGLSREDYFTTARRPSSGTPLGKLIAQVHARNAHAGDFYLAAGDALDKLRGYPAAGRFYQQAIERMPQLVAPYGQLGLIQMRLADESAAEKTLKQAFEIDPFNVRVSNSLKVLEVLSGYATIETEHFVIKFDRAQDEVLARAAAKFLEDEVYPALSKQLGYEPQGKSLFEFFSRAKNTDGHGWFSARMIGLPYVGTVAACAGKVVAMQSPGDAQAPFNWARVLRHEFVHVVNLQQTNFGVPHWFTEALAVYNEELPRPESWKRLLSEALKSESLFSLDTINGGFVRPKSTSAWNLAYCQAELYAEYMLDRFGDGALAKMLTAYADNLTTAAAIERSFGVKQDEFEHGYREHIKKVAAQNAAGREAEQQSQAKLKALAREYLLSGENHKLAGVLAELAAVEVDSLPIRKKLALLAYERKDWPEAARWTREAIHIAVKDAEMHRIAGEAAAALEKHEDAIHAFQLVLRLEEGNSDARAGLIRAYAASEQWDKARVELEVLRKMAPGDPAVKELEKLLR
jgi:Tfp pilus assembly protein PilF